MLIKPRYLGILIREEPLEQHLMAEFNRMMRTFDQCKNNGDIKTAEKILAKWKLIEIFMVMLLTWKNIKKKENYYEYHS